MDRWPGTNLSFLGGPETSPSPPPRFRRSCPDATLSTEPNTNAACPKPTSACEAATIPSPTLQPKAAPCRWSCPRSSFALRKHTHGAAEAASPRAAWTIPGLAPCGRRWSLLRRPCCRWQHWRCWRLAMAAQTIAGAPPTTCCVSAAAVAAARLSPLTRRWRGGAQWAAVLLSHPLAQAEARLLAISNWLPQSGALPWVSPHSGATLWRWSC
mmetsp:Transcript_47891/g.133503  ORF Transcript_47891/g.133503 Transcript_47891/m.133503 type:complete len:212 (-) Transcript_47891:2014-2649(-)